MRTCIHNSNIVSIYNADKKEIIGVFSTSMLAIRYLYDNPTTKDKSNFRSALKRKGRIYGNTLFEFPIAVRYATPQQVDDIGTNSYVILNNYAIPRETKMNGFVSNNETFKNGFLERNERRWTEEKNKKNNHGT